MELVAVINRQAVHLRRGENNVFRFRVFHTFSIKATTTAFSCNGVISTATGEMDVTVCHIGVKAVVTTDTFKANVTACLCVNIFRLACTLNTV